MANNKYRLLIIDDEPDFYFTFERLTKSEFEVTITSRKDEALSLLQKEDELFDCILLDLLLERESTFGKGLSFLSEIKMRSLNRIPVIVVSYDERVSTVERALDKGAVAFLTKKHYELKKWKEDILQVIAKFSQKLFQEHTLLISSEGQKNEQNKLNTLYKYYKNCPIVIQGEQGTGKKLWVKNLVDSIGTPYNLVNLNSIDLSELIAVVKNDAELTVFTGMESLFNAFNLDQIETKKVLLAILQKSKRVILISNQNLDKIKRKDSIDTEIIERLMPFAISIIPLRERREDIEILVNTFLREASICTPNSYFWEKTMIETFDKEVIEIFKKYEWVGNIKELRNVMREAILKADIQGMHLIDRNCCPKPINNYELIPRETESEAKEREMRQHLKEIEDALVEYKQNLDEVASALGIKNEESLRKHVKEIHLEYTNLFYKDFHIIHQSFGYEQNYRRAINMLIWCHTNSETFFNRIRVHLKILEWPYPLVINSNVEMLPGDDKEMYLKKSMSDAHIVIIMLCSDLLYECHSKILELTRNETKRILPFKAKPCTYDGLPLDEREPLHDLKKAIALYPRAKREDIISGAIQKIKIILHEMQDNYPFPN